MFHRPENELQVRIVAPEKDATELNAVEVLIPGGQGVFTVQPNHTNVLSTLLPGVLVATDPAGKEIFFAVSGGFVEVNGNRVVVLADTFEPGDQVDKVRAQAALDRAEKRLGGKASEVDMGRAEASLHRAMARLSAQLREGY